MTSYPVRIETYETRDGRWLAQMVVTISDASTPPKMTTASGATARGASELEAVTSLLLTLARTK